ncbi:MAG: HEAT repeat domain-containing protein [Myxococcales bacterium]|nr:HEAT repeat domain-containing protein [Myxococcales bacterium]
MSTRSIARGLRSDNPAVIVRALRRLARLMGANAEDNKRRDNWQELRDELAADDAEQMLLKHADSEDPTTRELAVDGLAVWLGDAALVKLLKRAGDPIVEVRASAVGGLESWPDSEEALDILIASADDGEWNVRWRAARALGQFREEEAEDALFGALLDPDSNVRCAAGDALLHHDKAAILPRLRHLFDHPTAHMLDSALDLIGEIGGVDDAKFLAKVGGWTNLSQPPQVRRWARDASKRIKERHRG